MALFQTVRRAKRWPIVLPLHDGRRCPDCSAIVIGDKGQQVHRTWHVEQAKWQRQVFEALRQITVKAGLNPVEAPDGGEVDGLDKMPEDEIEYGRPVSWRTLVTARGLTAADYAAMSDDDDDDE